MRSYGRALWVTMMVATLTPATAIGQQNVPQPVRQVESSIEEGVRRFGGGVQGGVGLDPEMLNVGAHVTFGPLFSPRVRVRPGVEIGLGEVTTFLGINIDVVYTLPGSTIEARWTPYVGAGPNFGYVRRDFSPDDDDEGSRFDFSDSDGTAGFNFIAGARNQNGLFIELKATAYGVSNIRLLAGFDF